MQKTYFNTKEPVKEITGKIHQNWLNFIRYCEKLGFGELQKVLIQDGVPVSAEKATEKIKFS
ncbi:MAG: hypothetical protein V1709_01020 [Planctomycetota bacterium]